MEGEGLGADGKGQPGSNADPPAPVFCCQAATLGADPRSPPETLPPRRVFQEADEHVPQQAAQFASRSPGQLV